MKGAGCETCGFRNRRDIETFPYDETFGQTESIKCNIQQQRKEYRAGKVILKSTPSHVVVQVTEACNYECVMCFQSHRPESMEEETLTRSLSGIEALDEIQFTGGEPFLSKPVQRFLKTFDISTGQKLSFTTNGSLLHMFRKELERLPRLHLGLSLDAATEATYEKIRKGGDWAQVKENVEWFAAARKERYRGWKTSRLAFVVMKSNYEEIPLFVEWAASLGMPVLFAPVWGEFAPEENIYSHPELQEGLTPPELILERAELAAKTLPDMERNEIIKSLRESLGQLTQAAILKG